MKNFILSTIVLFSSVGAASAQYSQVPYPFGLNQPYGGRSSTSYPFGYRSPYQGGFDGAGTFYGRGYGQYRSLPRYAPYGYPSQVYPSYQPYLNPYYAPRPYLAYPYYYSD